MSSSGNSNTVTSGAPFQSPKPQPRGLTGNNDSDAWDNPIQRALNNDNNSNNNNNNQQNNNNNNNNNDTDDDIVIDNLFKDIKRKDNTNNNQNNQNNQNNNNNNNNNGQQPTAEQQLNQYLESVGLSNITVDDATKAQIEAGDFSGLVGKLNAGIRQAHVQALRSARTMIDAAVGDALKQAKNETQSFVLGRDAQSALYRALPWANEDAISPIAETVMQKAIDRGANTQQAIKIVERWFNNVGEKVTGNKTNRNPNTNRNTSYRDSGANDETGEGDVDWASLLRGR